MGSVGDCYDNAMCESFFATLECELIERESFTDRSEARLLVFDCIEGFYNPHRIHSALDYSSPMTYEKTRDSREQMLPQSVGHSPQCESGHLLCFTGFPPA